ncbi:hypothetical protein D3C85_817310 [compost metagenome]
MRALHHPPDGEHRAEGEGEDKRCASHARATVTQYEKQGKQGETGGRMAAGPATPWFIGVRARTQQFAVGLVTAELFEAPWALHRGHCFHGRDKGSRQAQGQYQATQFPLERFEPGHEERSDEGEDGKHREGDDHLLGAIVQDVLEEVTVASDEFPGDRVVKQPGQVHVQTGQFEQHQNDRGNGRDSKAHPEIERTRSGAG